MTEVKSPYNFVPAPTESEVYKPEWANQVSHDIPFSDGKSGEITLKISAETPIFIRNGHAKDVEENEFSHIGEGANKRYFIPATSIKGMIRNVLEIMSFSRMKQVDDDKFAIRDLSSNNNFYMKQMKSSDGNKTFAGWLQENSKGEWSIIDCGEPGRINHQELKEKKGLSFRDDFLNKEPKNDDEKTAKYKYDLATKQTGFSLTDTFRTVRQDTRLKAFYSSDGEQGTIVFTGQPGKRKEQGSDKKKYNGKFYEFVFFETDTKAIPLSNTQKQEFLFVYNDNKKDQISKDWAFWKEKLSKGERIPVFFKKDKNSVMHFGLAYLYKLPYRSSIHESLPYYSYDINNNPDLSEVIFGKISSDEQNYSLKGRVFISHAFSQNAIPSTNIVKEILGSPKASYFPFYLEQIQGSPNYQDYSSQTPILRGFKRFPSHSTVKKGEYSTQQLQNDKVFSKFIPLERGAVFECRIRFHNLRKVELGALLSAITFHNTPNLFHSLGAAKPYGFGKVNIAISKGYEYFQNMAWFENKMNEELKKEWIQTPQIRELFSMAQNPISQIVDSSLKYPQLELPNVQPKDANEFVNYKKASPKLFLRPYSTINGTDSGVVSLAREANEQREQEIQQLLSSAKEAEERTDFETARNCYKKLDKLNIAGFDLSAKLQDVELKKTKHLSKIEEQRRLEEVLSSEGIELIDQFLKDYPLNSKKQELEVKLSSLKASSGIPERLKSLTNWDNFKKEAPRWEKKVKDNGEFAKFEAEFQDVVEKVIRVQFDLERTKKPWLKGDFKSNSEWKKVIEWLGKEKAEELYNELTNSK
jgi:CRISPR-associated protein (TIGR03986 family)